MRPRTEKELKLMRVSGKITASALKKSLGKVRDGVSLLELEKVAEGEILRLGGKPSFKTVPGYRWATCLTINDEVVHGIPRDIKLKMGDILGIDLGTVFRGWHTDAAWSVVVGEKAIRFLQVGEEALWKGIDQVRAGNRIGDISEAIQKTIEGEGFFVVRSLVGHGVGKKLHEEPQVPGYGKKGTGVLLKEGMTLAIEAIYTAGTSEVKLKDDGWTIASIDGSDGGLFEMTVIVGKEKSEVLTDWRKV